ncbi:MAG: Fur family transcriptional regulator [Candidatus Dormibacteria bacterium]
MPAPRHKDTEERLATLGHRLTAQRVIILEALRRRRRTITAQELFAQVRAEHPYLGRATVFRNLDALVDVGLAQRFERSGHVYAYASCSDEHHHHLVCAHCHRATAIDEATVAPLIHDLEGAHGFRVEHSALDFHGTCSNCRTKGLLADA